MNGTNLAIGQVIENNLRNTDEFFVKHLVGIVNEYYCWCYILHLDGLPGFTGVLKTRKMQHYDKIV